MSANDLITLEAHFSTWQESRGSQLEHPFTYYCLEHALSKYDLSDEEISSGLTDGTHDGGIDAAYIFLDDQLANDNIDVRDLDGVSGITLHLFQIKNSNKGFSDLELEKIHRFLPDILNLDGPHSGHLQRRYSQAIVQKILLFRRIYRNAAKHLPHLRLVVSYITKGDALEANERVLDVAELIRETCKGHMTRSTVDVTFVNAQALLEIVATRPPTSKLLILTDNPLCIGDHYIGSVKLSDYAAFLRSESGVEQRNLYDSNVRGFLGDKAGVNRDIQASLASNRADPDFWLLNNGITLICRSAEFSGGKKHLMVTDPQIVNGLQTSRTIYNHFHDKENSDDSRKVIVRVIVSTDETLYDLVIRATNNQNKMSADSLRSTGEIHKQLEAVFARSSLFYERRKRFYKDLGKPATQIVSMTEVVQAMLALVLRKPKEARGRPGDYLRLDVQYEQIFGGTYDLNLYVKCIQIMRLMFTSLTKSGVDRGTRHNLVFYVAFLYVALVTKQCSPTPESILTIDHETLDEDCFRVAHSTAIVNYETLGGNDSTAKGPRLVEQLEAFLINTLG